MERLRRFFRNPSAFFVGQRLGARLPEADEEPSSLLPVDLKGLVCWQVATRLLQARMGGVTTDRWRAVERERGTLPAGSLEDLAVQTIEPDIDALVGAAAARGVGIGPPDPFEVDVELADGLAWWDRYRSVSGGHPAAPPGSGTPTSSPSTGSMPGSTS